MANLMLITGGTSGIGLGIAKACVQKFDLALAYAENHERAQEAFKVLRKINPDARIEVFPKVLMSVDDCKQLMAHVDHAFSATPDALVNSMGRLRDGLFMSVDMQDHQDMIMEHLIVPMTLSQMCLRKMYKQKYGRIINLSSITAQRSKKGQVNYTTVKSSIEGFTRSLALEVAHRGVTVNAVAPGIIDTPMTFQLIQKMKATGKTPQNIVPSGFLGEAKDIGDAVSFLCSDSARYITGQTLKIDGGRSLGEIK